MSKVKQVSKEKWLSQRVPRDIYGRTYNLSDVPMTMMTREESFKKQGHSQKDIDEFYKTVPESSLSKYFK